MKFKAILAASTVAAAMLSGGAALAAPGGNGGGNSNGNGGGTPPVSADVTVGQVTLIAADCASIASARGCLFNGNIAPNTVTDTQAAFNLFNDTHPEAGADIALNLLFKSDDGSDFLGAITGAGTASGTWSTPGYAIDFLGVKASNNFVLYALGGMSQGLWDTFEIPFKNNPHALSHLSFFGRALPVDPPVSGVPEPATWAMMITGFGLVGAASRRRRAVAA